jgi:predicted RNase H-like HicB family nuclease
MLTDYIRAAMERAEYSLLANGSYYGEIPGVQGVWADGRTLAETQRVLQEVLEGWIVLRLERQLPIPTIGGVSLHLAESA